jgi:hypothetical protein
MKRSKAMTNDTQEVLVTDENTNKHGDTELRFTYKGFNFVADISPDDCYHENPFEEDLGDVVAIHYINSLPSDYDTEEEFFEHEDVPESFPMLYEGGLLLPFHRYAENTSYAFIDPLETYNNMCKEWGTSMLCTKALVYIARVMERYNEYADGFWHYAVLRVQMLDVDGEPLEDYEDCCGGHRSYYFDRYDRSYEHGLGILADMAHGIRDSYMRKGCYNQLTLPLEGL